MPEKLLVPSIEQRLAGMLEMNRRMREEAEGGKKGKAKPAVTISREFGCEAYPMAERLKEILEKKTGESWALMDKGLLEEVAKHHELAEEIFASLGKKPRFLDEMISTLSTRWKSEKDYYRLLCRQIVSLASGGNVIIIGRGSPIITQQLDNCYHFRMYASHEFKVRSIARRAGIPVQEAEHLVERKQRERDKFIRDFLDRDAKDLSIYHLVFNNDKNPAAKIAQTIAAYMFLKAE